MLTVLSPETFDWSNISLEDCLYGNALDTSLTLRIFFELEKFLKELNLIQFFEHVLSPTIEMFSEAEFRGCDIDLDNLEKQGKELNHKMLDLEDQILEKLQKQININSGKQLGELFYTDEDGLGLYPLSNSEKTGDPTLDEPSLSRTLDLINEELIKRGEKVEN